MPESYQSWYEKTFPFLSGNGLWLRGGEPNCLPVEEYQKRSCRILITRLSTYLDTAESFTHKLLYQIMRKVDGIFPDLAYLPPPKDGLKMQQDQIPWLIGTQTKYGPNGFDVIALSNSIVQELINVPVMLERSGIPLSKSQRMADPAVPLVILGGANALCTSLFFIPDPPVDGIFIGESTGLIAKLFQIIRDGKISGKSKNEILTELDAIPGFLQPDKPHKTKINRDKKLDINTFLTNAPILFSDENMGRSSLQISEGCPSFCSFCAEGWMRKPYREVGVDEIITQAQDAKARMGLDKIELYSFNFAMHREFYQVIDKLSDVSLSIGLKSQRFDSIADDPGLVQYLHALGKTSLTCGLEGISARLRRYLHKSLDENRIRCALSILLKSPLRELKIFLVATGLELDDDIKEFQALVKFISGELENLSSKPRIIFSLTPLVRFPWTPLEFEDAPTIEYLRPILQKIKHAVCVERFEFRLSSRLEDYLISQILVRADEKRIYQSLLKVIGELGFVFYREFPEAFANQFISLLEKSGLLMKELLGGRSVDALEAKPWEMVDIGISRGFIKKQYLNAKQFVDIGHCLGTVAKKGSCKACGACDDSTEKSVITNVRIAPAYPVSKLREKIREQNDREIEIRFLMHINEKGLHVPRKIIGVVLAGSLMKAVPDLVPLYRGYKGSFWHGDGPVIGDDMLTLLWQENAGKILAEAVSSKKTLSAINQKMQDWGALKDIIKANPEKIVIETDAPFRINIEQYCNGLKLKYQLRKNAGKGYWLEFSKEALKKDIVSSVSFDKAENGTGKITLVTGAKFDPREFAEKAYVLPDAAEWVRVKMISKMYFAND